MKPTHGGLAVVLALTACASSVDGQRATTCRRAVPALAPAGTSVRILRIGTGATPDELRVDYAVAGQTTLAARQRWVTCGFGPGAELLSIATEQGPMNGAALYLLKHFYLDTPEAEAADPLAAKP